MPKKMIPTQYVRDVLRLIKSHHELEWVKKILNSRNSDLIKKENS